MSTLQLHPAPASQLNPCVSPSASAPRWQRRLFPSWRRVLLCILLMISLGYARGMHAGDSSKVISAELSQELIRVDGKLQEPVWLSAEKGGGFTQRDPDDGKPSTVETQFQVAYDQANLYVAARLTDDPTRIVGKLTRRDRDSESDWLGVSIDSHHDHQTGRFFFVNPAGVLRDGSLSSDVIMDDSWDGVWEAAVAIDGDGWVVEMRIPFSALRFSAQDKTTWGLQITRYVSRIKEQSHWAPHPKRENRFVSQFGHLTGMNTIQAPRRLAVTPYGATAGEIQTSTDARPTSNFAPNGGLDLQYGVTTDLTLDLTANPDFGQVEVDQAVVNLTAFETFFQEKRPFFLEGADIFSTVGTFGDDPSQGTRLFYSRRIGATPIGRRSVAIPDGATLTENPGLTPILGAAKLTGRQPSGLSIGVLEAVTAPTYARLQLANGVEEEVQTAPLTSYGVARLKHEVGSSSYVGGIVTAVNREGTDYPDAYVGATDVSLRSKDGMWSATGMLAGSARVGTDDTQLGSTGRVMLSKDSGSRLVAAASYAYATPGFEVNDLGYMRRVNEHGGFVWAQLRDLDGLGPFRQARLNGNLWRNGLIEPSKVSSLGGNANVNLVTRGYWYPYAGVGFDAPAWDAYEARVPGRLMERPGDVYAFAGFQTDSRKALTLNVQGSAATDELGAYSMNLAPTLTLRAGSRTELSAGGGLTRGLRELAFVGLSDDPLTTASSWNELSVFGRRDLWQGDVWARGTLTFARDVSLQFFTQLLTVSGRYQDYSRLQADGSQGDLGFTWSNPADFDAHLFNANLILRWEYRPGSTLYAVWTQSRETGSGDGCSSLGDSALSAFGCGATNALMLKLNYRWDA